MQILRSAVVGTGFIGPVHVEGIRRLGHQVVGILGSSHEKSRKAAEQLGLEKAYQNLSELLDDSSIDVVHLASPNKDHFSQCKQVLQAGKHLVCEKPLAMNSKETSELAQLAEKTKLVTAVNYNVRFYPMVLEAKSRVQRGDVGDIYHVNGSYLQDWLLYDTDYNWRVLAEHGGELRAVADIGTHWIDTICFITGMEIKSVCADLLTVHKVRQQPQGGSETFTASAAAQRSTQPISVNTEDYGTILLQFTNCAKGSVTVSQVMAGRKNAIRFELAGSKQAIAWESEEPNHLHVGYRNKPNESIARDPSTIGLPGYSDYPAGHTEGFPDTFKMLYRSIYNEIIARKKGQTHSSNSNTQSQKPLYASFADGHREVVICEAILQSHRERRWVDVGK